MSGQLHFHALEKEMAPHSSVLAWRIPGTGEPGGLLSMGSHRVGHDWSDLAAAAAASKLYNHFPPKKSWFVVCSGFHTVNFVTMLISNNLHDATKFRVGKRSVGCTFWVHTHDSSSLLSGSDIANIQKVLWQCLKLEKHFVIVTFCINLIPHSKQQASLVNWLLLDHLCKACTIYMGAHGGYLSLD